MLGKPRIISCLGGFSSFVIASCGTGNPEDARIVAKSITDPTISLIKHPVLIQKVDGEKADRNFFGVVRLEPGEHRIGLWSVNGQLHSTVTLQFKAERGVDYLATGYFNDERKLVFQIAEEENGRTVVEGKATGEEVDRRLPTIMILPVPQ